ncbi:F-box domain-containing protein [Mycena sanguinolenta]|uniref:F-box domain-containing protein n=1 Tax=Mycena sanguinolenta TaxID=230812 RepID=A0A8H6Y7U2_9AGAR|nr:F-box domain-containing protein [Mycena sanguinolenta]
MPFVALGEDVLLKTFCFCDISTVLAVSAINKGLRRIALSKQLWLSLVLDPRFRDALDLPPPNGEKLECLSTEELIDVVKNAVTGPCPIGDSEHDESSSVTLTSVQIPLDDVDARDHSEARLLPGARYFLLHSASTTQQRWCIYDIWNARRVWERLVQGHTMCEVDLMPGSAVARVFFVQTVDHSNTCTLHVEEVDLTTGASHELFNFSFDRNVFEIKPRAIVGDFLLAPVGSSRLLLILINWRARTFVFLQGHYFCYARLIPGYIISMHLVLFPRRDRGYILAVTALEAFSDRWQSLTDDSAGLAAQLKIVFPSAIPIHRLNIATQERLEYTPIFSDLMSVTSDPLCAGAYNISLQGFQFPKRLSPCAMLMERIGNRILSMAGAARWAEALHELAHASAQVVLCYQFTPAVSAAGEGCSLRLVSTRRVSDGQQIQQVNCPRASIPLSEGSWIDVVYREGKRTGVGRCTSEMIHPFAGSILEALRYYLRLKL